jgi:hypothetical protein
LTKTSPSPRLIILTASIAASAAQAGSGELHADRCCGLLYRGLIPHKDRVRDSSAAGLLHRMYHGFVRGLGDDGAAAAPGARRFEDFGKAFHGRQYSMEGAQGK